MRFDVAAALHKYKPPGQIKTGFCKNKGGGGGLFHKKNLYLQLLHVQVLKIVCKENQH